MPDPLIFAVICILWAVPLFGTLLAPARWFMRSPLVPHPLEAGLVLRLGALEYGAGVYRDGLAVCAASGLLVAAAFGGDGAPLGLALLALAALSRAHRRRGNRRAIDHLLRNPDVHPDEFYRAVHAWRSPWPPLGPVATRTVGAGEVHFSAPSRNARAALALGLHDTGFLAKLTTMAFLELGPGVGGAMLDTLMRVWSTRVASRLGLRLVVTGSEALRQVRSQAVIVLNHESFLDFCLSFYALGGVPTARGRRLAPRFIAARDHFLDNPFLYGVLGVGRAIEAAGMIFVDRKSRGAARRVIDEAVQTLRTHDVDVAIFPQGTRARPHVARSGGPSGAGYYTTGRGLPGVGHFRKGAALIAARLAEHQAVDIVCVGIVGTAAVAPAGSFQVHTERTVHYHILPPLHLERGAHVEEEALTRRIELQLRRTAQVHARLLASWQEEVGLPDTVREAIAGALSPWDEREDPIPYAALDAVLSLPPARRRPWLDELEALASGQADDTAWTAFRERVAEALSPHGPARRNSV